MFVAHFAKHRQEVGIWASVAPFPLDRLDPNGGHFIRQTDRGELFAEFGAFAIEVDPMDNNDQRTEAVAMDRLRAPSDIAP